MKEKNNINYSCLVCQNKTYSYLFTKENANYYRCENCGVHFQYPQPGEEELESLYGNSENVYQKQILYVSRLHADLNFKYIKKNIDVAKYKSLLEIGCGPGHLLHIFKNLSYKCSGVELSQWSRDYIKTNFDIDIYIGEFSSLDLTGKQFDIVIMSYVFEHLKDPDTILQKIYQVLNPSGILIMTTPNVSSIFRKVYRRFWRYYQPDEHIFLYNKSHISKILKRNKFTLIKSKSIQGFKIFLYEFPKYTRSTVIRIAKNFILKFPINVNFWLFNIKKWKPQKDLFIRPMSIFDNIMVFAQKEED